MVLRPVAMLAADSRVVALIEVPRPNSSSIVPPAASKVPPAPLINCIRSADSTANLPATAFIEPKTPSTSLASFLNCLIRAITPSVVCSTLSKVGARSDLAIAAKLVLTSSAAKPACAKTRETDKSFVELTPNPVDRDVISSLRSERPLIDVPVT